MKMNSTNPFKRLRIQSGYSQRGFAALVGLSRTTLVYIESGQFPHLSEYMVNVLYDKCKERGIDPKDILVNDYGTANLNEAYIEWCRVERYKNRLEFRIKVDFSEYLGFKHSPFNVYIQQHFNTRQKFCKTLKVSDAEVYRYSLMETRMMPYNIEQAFREVGFPYLEDLKEAQESWLYS